MPSMKPVITTKKAAPQLPEAAFFISRTSRFAPKKPPPPARPAEPAELKTGLNFLGANREVGGRYSHLDAVLKRTRDPPGRFS